MKKYDIFIGKKHSILMSLLVILLQSSVAFAFPVLAYILTNNVLVTAIAGSFAWVFVVLVAFSVYSYIKGTRKVFTNSAEAARWVESFDEEEDNNHYDKY